MSEAGATRGGSPFSKAGVLAIVLVGFIAFLALLYFLSAGDTGDRRGDGAAHGSATGLNGYAAFARLLEAENYNVTLSRSESGLETYDLLILTPPLGADPEDIQRILNSRRYVGPTIVILPKWMASEPTNVPEEVEDEFKEGWVQLGAPIVPDWTNLLSAPFRFETEIEQLEEDEAPTWSGLGRTGELPTRTIAYAKETDGMSPIITDDAGHVLAFAAVSDSGDDFYDDAYWTVFVTDPDLVNNYGMASEANADAALALVDYAGYDEVYDITFDMTLHGYGSAENLLTLAFRPPFLAATICLLLAILIVGWRAFLRFGPAAARGPEIAFGKKQLVRNAAGLIVRGNRLTLLTDPYAQLAERRIAAKVGLTRHDPESLDAALASRLPNEEPFSLRAQRLRNAQSPTDILRAAQALRELEGKLAK